jgi:uncharacterized protein YeaO (DUF488 family)
MSTTQPMVAPDKKEFDVQIRLPKNGLAKGKYMMDFWVGFGAPTTAVRYYDTAYDTVTFKVENFRDQFINEWHGYWGHYLFELESNIK